MAWTQPRGGPASRQPSAAGLWAGPPFPRGYFDVIAAGPPCGDYSFAKNFTPRRFHHADRLVKKNCEYQPRLWWITPPGRGPVKQGWGIWVVLKKRHWCRPAKSFAEKGDAEPLQMTENGGFEAFLGFHHIGGLFPPTIQVQNAADWTPPPSPRPSTFFPACNFIIVGCWFPGRGA